MKLGLLGGTFNPVHIGHLLVAEECCDVLGLDRVLFVPAYIPPHKETGPGATPAARYRMLKSALRGNRRFTPCDVELARRGTSYTVDTVRWVRDRYRPADRPYLIVGADLAGDLHTWKDYRELFEMVHLVVVERSGDAGRPPAGIRTRATIALRVDVSSTAIRDRAARGQSVRYLVPDRVERFIRRHGLYGSTQ